jgi:hypothetical protein
MAAYFAQVGFKKGQVGREVIFAEAGGSFKVTPKKWFIANPRAGK